MSLPPDPEWTDTPREAMRDNAKPKILSLTPDVCKTLIGNATPPIPYCVVGYPDEAADNYTNSVFFTGQKAMVLRSSTTCCHGDEPGTAKGVKSGAVGDICEPLDHSATVRAEGSPVIRDGDKCYMNAKNTIGRCYWTEDTETYGDTYPDDKAAPVGQQLAFLSPAAAAAIEAAGATGGAAAAAEGAAATGLGAALAGAGALAIGTLFPTNKMNFSDVVPRDDYETTLLKSAQDEITALPFWDSGADIRNQTMAKIKRHREAEEKPEPKPSAPVPPNSNVRVTERDKYRKKCEVGPYREMQRKCGQYGMEAHHIVPDWTLRYGTRTEAKAGQNRIPGMPGYWDGQTICVMGKARVEDTEHWGGHLADKAIEHIGETSSPPYTATLSQVRNRSVRAMVKVRPDCVKQINEAMAKQFAGKNPNQLLRAKQKPPLPQETINALKSGTIKTWP